MQYIRDGAATGLRITNDAARGLSNTFDQIARRRREKASMLFNMGQTMGVPDQMAEGMGMLSGKKVDNRVFVDQDGNVYGGSYDQVRMGAENKFREQARGGTYLDKINAARQFNSFMTDVNAVYARGGRNQLRDDYFGGGGGGEQRTELRGLNYVYNGTPMNITYVARKDSDWSDADNRQAATKALRAQGYDDKTIKDILSDPKNFTPNLPLNAAAADKRSDPTGREIDARTKNKVEAERADEDIEAVYSKHEGRFFDDQISNSELRALNEKYKGKFSIKPGDGIFSKRPKRVPYDKNYYAKIVAGSDYVPASADEEADNYLNGR